jgi:toluene monooxygenase system protein E
MKTYSHLAAGRRPTEYEIVTTRLHHHVERGFEVRVPVADWYERYQRGSRWQAADWEAFADPRETTYTAYTRLQRDKEAFVDGLLARIDASSYDRDLPAEARALIERAVLPLRFPFHGLQMIAAYVGQMAPSSRITIAALLQGADEIRRIHRLAYRMAQLRAADPVPPGTSTFGEDGRARWETDPCWQPLRRLVESLLVTYDWAEAFVALNVCLKPLLDELTMVEVGALARARGDFSLGQILASLDEDCQWHRRWTAALVRVAIAARPENGEACRGWVEAWLPEAREAVRALAPLLGSDEPAAAAALAAAESRATAFVRALELAPAGGAP